MFHWGISWKQDKKIPYGEPITVTSEPGVWKRTFFQRFRIHPDFYIVLHNDGRVRIESKSKSFFVRDVRNHNSNSVINIQLYDKGSDDDENQD